MDQRGFSSSIKWISVAAATMCGCHVFGDNSSGFAETHDLVKEITKVLPAAHKANEEVLGKLAFEAFRYQQVTTIGSDMPVPTPACGVRYTLPDKSWGLVPNLSYECDDKEAAKKSLGSAPTVIRNRIGIPLDQVGARLDVLSWPSSIMERIGDDVVKSNVLQSGFKLESCVTPLADRLSQTRAEVAAARCDIFAAPAGRVKELRATLEESRNRARKILSVPLQRKVKPATEAQVAACHAAAGTVTLDAPGSSPASGSDQPVASGQPVAYRFYGTTDEEFEIEVSGPRFDTVIEVRDETCSKTLGRSDRAGTGQPEHLSWKATTETEYVLVISTSSPSTGPVGPYQIRFSPEKSGVRVKNREVAEKFSEWFDKATDNDLEDTWRGSASKDFQLACVERARMVNEDAKRWGSINAALQYCESGLLAANDARVTVLRGDLPRRVGGGSVEKEAGRPAAK
jgi:hypothetical protein